MGNELVRYQGLTEEQLRSLPEEQILGICHDLIRYCNHTVKATSEKVRASLARMDATEKMAELYRTVRQTPQ